MEPSTNKVGDDVFIHDPLFEWIPATILALDKQTKMASVQIKLPPDWKETTYLCESSTANMSTSLDTRTISLTEYKNHMLPLRSDQLVRDMADLPHLHEASILYQVKRRHAEHKPYTRVGEIVIAVNPCQWIPSLYSLDNQQAYAQNIVWQVQSSNETRASEEKKDDDESRTSQRHSNAFGGLYDRLGYEPHAYEVSSLAYRGLALDGRDQTILVSGESGAGKTETVKIVLKHLARLPEWRPSIDGYQSDQAISHRLVDQIMQGLPIFEAFGNATTRRNHNSSRFGKVTRLHFAIDTENHICHLQGATSDTHLLEKSRVVSQVNGERNFHIFYQLLTADSEVKRSLLGPEWGSTTALDFKYLCDIEMNKSLEDDRCLWETTLTALQFFGWKNDTLRMLLQALGIVLRLGNLSFAEGAEGEATVTSREDLFLLSTMMGIDMTEIEHSIVTRRIVTGCEHIEVPHTVEQAKDACDALAKALYAQIFSSVVSHVNQQSAVPGFESDYSTISLVDIFGFESFETNGFEQLCVNYTSEKLQHKYVHDNMMRLIAEYKEEGIEMVDFSAIDNSETIKLFEGYGYGLISSLDEECVLPNGNSEAFVYKIKSSNKCLIIDDLQKKTEFGIMHFAGPVVYDAKDFLERNYDKLPIDLIELGGKSSNGIIRYELLEVLKREKISESVKKLKKISIAEKFRVQLRVLLDTLSSSEIRYIRCIKPNNDLEALLTDHSSTLRQLRCAGLVAAMEMSRESFPNKLTFETAVKRFECLLDRFQRQIMKDMPLHDKAIILMSALFAETLEKYRDEQFSLPYACGKTKVYFRAGALEHIEGLRIAHIGCSAIKIQSFYRMAHSRKAFLSLRESLVCFQAKWRGSIRSARYKRLLRAVVVIQSLQRRKKIARRFDQIRSSTIIVQYCFRKHLGRRRYATVAIQAWGKACLYRHIFLRKVRNAITIQSCFRRHQAVNEVRVIRRAACVVTAFCRMIFTRRKYQRIASKATIVQALFRARCARRELHTRKRAAFKITRWAREAPMFIRIRIAVDIALAESRRRHEFEATRSRENDLIALVECLEETMRIYKAQIEEKEVTAKCLCEEVSELREKQLTQLQEIEALRAKESIFRKEIEQLRGEVIQVSADAEMHTQELESEFDDRLIEYEKEVLALKHVITTLNEEKDIMKMEMQTAQDNYKKTVTILQQGARDAGESHKEYLGKVARFIEASNESHQAEITRFANEIEQITRSKDLKIQAVEDELRLLRKRLSDVEASNKDNLSEEAVADLLKVVRKLEKLSSADNIIAVLESAGRDTNVKKYIEAGVSSRCRKCLDKLEDVIGRLRDEEKHVSGRRSRSCEAEAVGLQNKLVRAYEEIERMREKIRALRPELSSDKRRKSPLKYFTRS